MTALAVRRRGRSRIRLALGARRALAVVAIAAWCSTWSAGAARAGTVSAPRQVITVEAATSRSVTAVVRTWARASTGVYRQVFPAVVADVGRHGVGPTREGLGRTPVGEFTLTRAFGNEPNIGTRLPYTLVGPDDWWDENPASPQYNELVRRSTSPGGASENLYAAGHAYAHAVVIDYNTDPVVKGAGSGFFLHVSFGAPTAG